MSQFQLAQIVAVAQNRVIGRSGALPWHLSADLKRFKRLTMGHPIIMGRRTYESIGRPLPGRKSIVVSRSAHIAHDQVLTVPSLAEAVGVAAELATGAAFIIGGAQLFLDSIDHVARLHVTHVRAAVEGDVYYPDVDWSQWLAMAHEDFPSDDRNDFPYSFVDYERLAANSS